MTKFLEHAAAELQSIRDQGLFKRERTIDSPQQTDIRLHDQREVLNLCEQLSGAGRSSGDHQSRPRSAGPLGLWNGVRAIHLRNADDS